MSETRWFVSRPARPAAAVGQVLRLLQTATNGSRAKRNCRHPERSSLAHSQCEVEGCHLRGSAPSILRLRPAHTAGGTPLRMSASFVGLAKSACWHVKPSPLSAGSKIVLSGLLFLFLRLLFSRNYFLGKLSREFFVVRELCPIHAAALAHRAKDGRVFVDLRHRHQRFDLLEMAF